MEINKENCTNMLLNQFIRDFSQSDNISQLMTNSRWNNKQQCFEELGGSAVEIQRIVNVWKNTESEQKEEIKTEPVKPEKTQPKKQESLFASIWSLSLPQWADVTPQYILTTAKTVGLYILFFFAFLIAWSIFLRAFRRFLRYAYAFCNSRRLIFLKVLLPRWDGKSDREQEKEIAKDMKEKIWRMSQVLWNLHKMNEISTHEKLMQIFFW